MWASSPPTSSWRWRIWSRCGSGFPPTACGAYRLVRSISLFSGLARNVLEHHDYYSPNLRPIPAVLHVADRVDIILKKDTYYLWQVEDILAYFTHRQGDVFSPEVVEALRRVAQTPSFWLDLQHRNYQYDAGRSSFRRKLTIDELEELGELVATIVDAQITLDRRSLQGRGRCGGVFGPETGHARDQGALPSRWPASSTTWASWRSPTRSSCIPGGSAGAAGRDAAAHLSQPTMLIRGVRTRCRRARGLGRLPPRAGWMAPATPSACGPSSWAWRPVLMAVADITQSLLEHRPYRPGHVQGQRSPPSCASNGPGGHIDPELTELAIAHLDEIMAIVDKHR